MLEPERERPENEPKKHEPQKEPIFHNESFDIPWAIEYDGHVFKSPYEYGRYKTLKELQRRGYIHSLEVGKRFDLVVNDFRVAIYECDFFYFRKDGTPVIEEIKGNILEKEFAIKWRLAKALFQPKGFRLRLLRFGKYEIKI